MSAQRCASPAGRAARRLPPLTTRVTPGTVGCMRLLGGAPGSIIMGMTKATEAVLADALRLDADSRAQLAAELLASLDGPSDPDAEAAWQVEIEQRVAALKAGKVKLEPWADVKRRIEKVILRR